ncbi:MAG: hypothetical protein WC875_05930 [Candidatus Absconditabacterales bacterium]
MTLNGGSSIDEFEHLKSMGPREQLQKIEAAKENTPLISEAEYVKKSKKTGLVLRNILYGGDILYR